MCSVVGVVVCVGWVVVALGIALPRCVVGAVVYVRIGVGVCRYASYRTYI